MTFTSSGTPNDDGSVTDYAGRRSKGCRAFLIDRDLSLLLAPAESSVRALSAGPGANGLAGIARFLLRSEALARLDPRPGDDH